MSQSKFFYSYTDFVNERINFKKVDRIGINRYDSPAALYYKLVFYFTEDSGLLGLNGVFSDDTNRIKNLCGAFYNIQGQIAQISGSCARLKKLPSCSFLFPLITTCRQR